MGLVGVEGVAIVDHLKRIVLNRSTQLVLCPWCSLDGHELQQYHRQFTPTRMGICCSSNSRSRNTQQNASNRELKEEDLRGIFKEFDLNGDGYIQKDELNAVMVKMGQCPTDDELNAMFDAADKDKDGNIDFDDLSYELRSNEWDINLLTVISRLFTIKWMLTEMEKLISMNFVK
ncbi:Uncharacterized protein BM_BM2346 [Brugia malayi]|uniref:EF-hand domain-containing protein n=1 Tax=Brugia malayi TaxID=6279 RepID=A0A4E9ESY5_BRUMA|nr:Uncharacterized protein BM_BM2346 [Brugia malayi]VIO87332.1 Uncharacterized protein BM_BM2346 [Brugia malayi]